MTREGRYRSVDLSIALNNETLVQKSLYCVDELEHVPYLRAELACHRYKFDSKAVKELFGKLATFAALREVHFREATAEVELSTQYKEHLNRELHVLLQRRRG